MKKNLSKILILNKMNNFVLHYELRFLLFKKKKNFFFYSDFIK